MQQANLKKSKATVRYNSTLEVEFMHSRHVPPAEDQAAWGVTHGSKAIAEERSVMAFSSASVEKERERKEFRANSEKRKALE